MQNNSGQISQVNVTELNNAIQETLIHIDLNTTLYSVSPLELENIEDGSSSIWKDITLTGIGLGVPCCVNAVIEYQKILNFNPEVFWNSLIGSVAISLAVIFGVIWSKSKNKCKVLIKNIRERPQYKMQ